MKTANSHYSGKNIFALFTSLIFGNANERVIFPLLSLVFFDQTSHLLPNGTDHALRSYWYGICMTLPSMGNFIAAPILSCLSDYYGRKRILVLSYLGAGCAGVLTSMGILSQHIGLFLFGIFVLGLFSRTNPIAQATVSDLESRNPSKKLLLMGRLQTAIAFGAFLGPLIGGYCAYWFFQRINFAAAFMLSALFGLCAAVIAQLLLKETLIERHKTISPINTTVRAMLGSLLFIKQRKTLLLNILLACGQFTWSLYYQFAPPILKLTSGFSATQLGFFVGLMAFWVMLGGSIGISVLRKTFGFRAETCLGVGLLLQLIGGLLILIDFHPGPNLLSWFSSFAMASGDVITFSVITTLYSGLYEPQQQGRVMGACFLNAAAVWTVTGLLGGYLMAINTYLPLIIAPITVLLAGILWLLKFNTNKYR